MGDEDTWCKYAHKIKCLIQHMQDTKVYPLANQWKSKKVLYEGNDARVYWFIGIARMMNNLKLAYISIEALGNSASWQNIVKGCPDPRTFDTDIKDWIREFETFILWAYVHGFCTNTEECLRLVYAMVSKNETDDFANIYDHLLKITSLQKFKPLFDLLRLIRNTTHTNGIFLPKNGKDRSLQWNSVEYNFKAGRGQHFANAGFFIETLTSDMCCAMDELMSSNIINVLPIITRRITA